MSQRRATRVIGGGRSSLRYQAVRPGDGVLRERLMALTQRRRRLGYRRLHVSFAHEVHIVLPLLRLTLGKF
jgi:putative transposase